MQAAVLRLAWRKSQGAVMLNKQDVEIRVEEAHLLRPRITIEEEPVDTPAKLLVAEMMIMAGEAVGAYGAPSTCSRHRPARAAQLPLLFNIRECPSGLLIATCPVQRRCTALHCSQSHCLGSLGSGSCCSTRLVVSRSLVQLTRGANPHQCGLGKPQ